MRLPVVTLILLVFLPFALLAQDRTSVHLFQYGSANDEGARAFEDFRYVLGEKLPQLAGEILEDETELARLSGLDQLSLEPVANADGNGLELPSKRIPNLAERRRYWEVTGALALLTGRIKQRNAGELTIRSRFFLGALGKVLGHETMAVELPVTAESYETTNDSHSVAILTVLAMEIFHPAATNPNPDCANRSEVFYLLNQASLRADAVALENHALGESLGAMVSAALNSVIVACSG